MSSSTIGGDQRTNSRKVMDSPTAALLRVVKVTRPTKTSTLNPQAMMLAMFPRDPWDPTLRVPHCGFTPTGADAGFADKPIRVLLE